MDESQLAETRRPGRPRTEGADERILSATLDLLSKVGYDAMSMASVAAEAGVTKPTVYRRWESKEDLVTSAVSNLAAVGPTTTSPDVWEALIAELDSFHVAISRTEGMALIGNVLALERRHPRLLELYRGKVITVRRNRIRAVLIRAQEAAAIPMGVDLDLVINLLVGYYYAARIGGVETNGDWPRRCVSLLRSGIETPKRP